MNVWELHPKIIDSDPYDLGQAGKAYELVDAGQIRQSSPHPSCPAARPKRRVIIH